MKDDKERISKYIYDTYQTKEVIKQQLREKIKNM